MINLERWLEQKEIDNPLDMSQILRQNIQSTTGRTAEDVIERLKVE